MTQAIELNGVTYQWPKRPVVVVCIDGGDPAYFERGLSDGILPNIRRFQEHGFNAVANGVMPSYHEPEQHVDCDRQSAVRSRDIGQLLP